ncbi:hypothetical protein [Sphingomonas sp.]|uniref:hypothetical protein n=1 Tax=Sphingomonas sp. TaxID=28214 RepID=UPI0018433B9B|nr:hypothetical protein [Sphingomonas sp.]MBA3510398.1 hypothetical protein [Sphingomonas sp.]
MFVHPLSYTQAILVGFVTGALIFLLSGLFVRGDHYFDQLWLLIACLAMGIALVGTATFFHHRLDQANRSPPPRME